MKILVCVEEGCEQELTGGEAGLWYDAAGRPLRLQADNEHALEQALRLKGVPGGGNHVTLLCIGPERAAEAVRRGLALGCDRGVHIIDPEARRRDPLQLAFMIVRFCRKSSFDLIVTGAGLGEVGNLVAFMLGCRSARGVAAVRHEGGRTVRCELAGERMEQHVELPAALICQSGPITLRHPTLPNLLGSRSRAIIAYHAAELLSAEAGQGAGTLQRPAGASAAI